jgi:hypothetical protein
MISCHRNETLHDPIKTNQSEEKRRKKRSNSCVIPLGCLYRIHISLPLQCTLEDKKKKRNACHLDNQTQLKKKIFE